MNNTKRKFSLRMNLRWWEYTIVPLIAVLIFLYSSDVMFKVKNLFNPEYHEFVRKQNRDKYYKEIEQMRKRLFDE